MIEDHPDPATRWKNRRRMTWLCVFGGLLYPLLTLATDSAALADIALPFYLFVGSVTGVYIGFSTAETMSIAMR